ncbi:stargazin related protein STG-1 isoform X1 [Neodiprion pinetum]|uniref:Voltage-dependent calcium channel gamma-5 subunit isoform X1 n=1 Tax=Neodiprion lecontei TaxID=441921 RepID=A0ABM3FFQ4_NEOLC|nr:voltage-dependent calcium channel gamma-5 subunit isoform X1 [Neodiprion fabricii]XP_046411126.1 voltage-dependent calcium channel gamma-5 subunit isoform X1 [Neodiprion fabricii]XP_046411127.1 voltage-dependent calcium channel gamma-5 subunit isoform X1 [Neodiprion fabricii]XP_046466746.1 voltage-dependent calcium channel gamma-5 subunit isoform X1 [Neodiprion pinetum]XP_046466747.1 voltage-dependent calcium channel gamma-5 subunit isoform X1 [Neodiprion pinetum]XP_046466748.1 voltage-depe
MSCCCACCCGGSGGNGGGLGITSGISALLSLIVITVAITTGEWLLTEERLPKSTSSNASVEPDSKVTYSGLWRVCATLASHVQYECFNIDYFPSEEYSPDPNDSTMAIPYAVTKSTMFFLAATLLLVAAEVCYFAAHVSHPKHRLCVFIAGVVFIVSGLLMLVGMVMYISVFKAEVGSKLRTRSSFQGPQFTYRYGFSFLLYVSGFITTEVAGTSAIFLYISWHQQEWIRKDSRRKNYGGVYQLEHHMHQQNHVNHQNHGSFLCERHQKRYFFGRDSVDVDFDEFLPPPPSLDYIEYPRQFPRDLTAQTVSTTADVLQEEYSPSAQHEFVTFDLEEPLPPPPPIRECGWGLDTIRRTTPV